MGGLNASFELPPPTSPPPSTCTPHKRVTEFILPSGHMKARGDSTISKNHFQMYRYLLGKLPVPLVQKIICASPACLLANILYPIFVPNTDQVPQPDFQLTNDLNHLHTSAPIPSSLPPITLPPFLYLSMV